MARRRKNDSSMDAVVELVSLMPWWLGVLLAVAAYLGLHALAVSPMPVVTGTGQMGAVMQGSLWRGLAMVGQYLLPMLCLVGAGTSAFNRRKAAQLHSDAANRADGVAQMSWQQFEVLVAEYFRRQGFSVTANGGSGPDGGVDVWLQKGSDRYLVQCKHWRARRVGVEVVREMYGLIAAQRLAGGYVVTSGDFTEEARGFADGRELKLINGRALNRGVKAQGSASAGSSPRSVASSGGTPVAPVDPSAAPSVGAAMPMCPVCGAAMALRTARQGGNAGRQFWGCSQFRQTKCRGTRELC